MKRWLAVAGVGLGALYVAGGAALASVQRSLYFPAPEVPVEALDEAARTFGCESLRLTAADGVGLYALYRQAGGDRAVLFLHGNGESVADRPELVAQLHMAGWDVLIPAYRGYPGSDGTPSEAGLASDADAAWTYLVEERGIAPDRIVVHGKSLGGAVATSLATRHPPAALVLESTFTSMTDMARRMAWMYPLSWLVTDPFPTLDRAPSIRTPVLLLHGIEDTLIPIEHARRNAAAFPDSALVEVPGEHGETLTMNAPEARRAYMALLSRVVP